MRRFEMKNLMIAAALLMIAAPAFGGIKPCEELKSEIDAKIKANGVKSYTLEIVPSDKVKDQKVVGSCDGGTKKIIYKRGE